MTHFPDPPPAPEGDPDQYLRFLTASVPVLLAYIDPQHHYRFANDAYARWFGRDLSSMIGKHVQEIIGPVAYEGIRNYIDVALAGMPVTFEREMPYVDIGSRYVHIAFVPDTDAGGRIRGISAAVTDITDRRSAEERTKKAQRELALVVAGARCLLWHADVSTRPDGILHWETRFADESILRDFGIRIEEGQDVAAAWHLSRVPEDRRRDDISAARHVLAGEDYSQEFRCLRSDDDLLWMKEDVRVEVIGENRWRLVGVTTDITDRKLAEAHRERLLRETREGAERQRTFLRDVLASVTGGRLCLISVRDELPPKRPAFGERILLTQHDGLWDLRHRTVAAARTAGLMDERSYDLMTAASEAGMNAIVHAGGGTAQVSLSPDQTIQVWVEDQGAGIAMENLPRATLARGYSTKATLGHGMKMILQMADRVFLLTGTSGTTIVLEQDVKLPLPIW